MRKNNRITVLGGGLWGTVLAQHLAQKKAGAVVLWEFFPKAAETLQEKRTHSHLPGFILDKGIRVTSDLAEAAQGASLILFVLPSHFVRKTAHALRKAAKDGRPVVVNACKGIEPGTLLTMGEVIADELPRWAPRVYTLSGPSFAREVAKGVRTKLVLAGRAGPEAEKTRKLFDGGALSVERSTDRKGVELGGSLKNVLAIGCGVLDGLKAGANTKAALLIQGMSEMGHLIARCGGQAKTVYGLAGLGDLIATGTSTESRNRGFGEKLGEGKTLQQALREIPTVVEGVEASASTRALCRRMGLKAPLLEAVWRVVHGGQPPELIVRSMGF